jgi:hypothetical protein
MYREKKKRLPSFLRKIVVIVFTTNKEKEVAR